MNILKPILAAGILFSFTACNNDDDSQNETILDYNELSETCKTIIETHFPEATVILVERKNVPDSDGTVYEVKLNNGMEIDFNAECNWTDIDGNNQRIPYALISEAIVSYVQTNYPEPIFIKGIDKESFGFEVELSNGVDLIFDTNGEFVRIDP